MDRTSALAEIPAPRPEVPRTDPPRFRVRQAGVRDGGENVYGVPILLHPPASAIADDMLSWLDDHECRAVLDPDARRWLRYDPARGAYSPVAGTAEQAARVFIREAADTCARYGGNGWRAKQNTLTGEEPLHLGMLPVSGHQASLDEIARAMVDLAASGKRAAGTRAQLAAGRRADIMFNPMTWCPRHGGFWRTATGCLGYQLSDEPGPDQETADYLAVPLRASGYAPALDDDGPAADEGFAALGDAIAALHPGVTPFREWAARDKAEHPERYSPHPDFDRICRAIWPDPVARDAALRSYSMGFTGRATKYVIYARSETGRGKSLAASLMADLLGGYARSVPAKTLFGYSADPQRAAQELAGCWLAIVEEGIGSASFKADEAFKVVTTGGGALNARALYQESRQETATHTILLAVNPEADMNYADPAIRARLCPVRFDGDPAEIAELAETYNPASAAWKAEAPAVLATMLGYARGFWSGAWKPYTLADIDSRAELAEIIDDDTALAIEMRTGSNVGAFIDAQRRQLAAEADGHRGRALYKRYQQWAAMNGDEAVTETAFGRAVQACAGVTRAREAKGTTYRVAPAGQ